MMSNQKSYGESCRLIKHRHKLSFKQLVITKCTIKSESTAAYIKPYRNIYKYLRIKLYQIKRTFKVIYKTSKNKLSLSFLIEINHQSNNFFWSVISTFHEEKKYYTTNKNVRKGWVYMK